MSSKPLALHDFREIPSRHVTAQETMLEWDAFRRARYLRAKGVITSDEAEDELRRRIAPDGIRLNDGFVRTRGHEVPDFLHHDIGRMEIFHDRRPDGASR